MREVKVDQRQIGAMRFGRGDRAVEIVGGRDDAIARIVLDQIFQRRRQLAIVFDDQDLEHIAPPRAEKSLFRKDMLRHLRARCKSPGQG